MNGKYLNFLKRTAAVHFVVFGIIPIIFGTLMLLRTYWKFHDSFYIRIGGFVVFALGVCLISFVEYKRRQRMGLPRPRPTPVEMANNILGMFCNVQFI